MIDLLGSTSTFHPQRMLEVGKMDKRKDLSMFDKSQIVAWGHVRAQAAAVVEYSRSAVPI